MNHLNYFFVCVFLCFSWSVFGQDIVINEFMASNDSLSGIVDEFGETDDWVELHNRTNNTVDISGYGFSDDYSLLYKWVFPSGILIPPNGYLIVWTDSDDEQGVLHTNFKLSASGERIMLANTTGVVLDSISYFQQETNVSMARFPNGTGPFIQQAPTFNANNGGVSIHEVSKNNLVVYPTVANSEIFIDNNEESNLNCQLIIYTLDGKKLSEINEVMTPFSTTNYNVEHLNSGSYLMSISPKNETPQNFYFRKQ